MSDCYSDRFTICSFISNAEANDQSENKSSSTDDKFKINVESFIDVNISDNLNKTGVKKASYDFSNFKLKIKQRKSREGRQACCGVKNCLIF